MRSAGLPKTSPGVGRYASGRPEDAHPSGAVAGGRVDHLDGQSIPWGQENESHPLQQCIYTLPTPSLVTNLRALTFELHFKYTSNP